MLQFWLFLLWEIKLHSYTQLHYNTELLSVFLFVCLSLLLQSLSLFLALSLSRSLYIWKMPPGTWHCQPKGYRAPMLVIVCNYPANLFTSAGAACWSWGSNCPNGSKNGKEGSDSSGWEWSFIIEAWEGGGRTEELIAFSKCMTFSEAAFSFSFPRGPHSGFYFCREDRLTKVIVCVKLCCFGSDSENPSSLLTSLFNRAEERKATVFLFGDLWSKQQST